YVDRLRYVPRGGPRPGGPSRISLQAVACERLVLSQGVCGLAQETALLFAKAGLAVDEYPGRAMSYAALEEGAELGLGGALLPGSKLAGHAHELPIVVDGGEPVVVAYQAMWSRAGVYARHVRAFTRYLGRAARAMLA